MRGWGWGWGNEKGGREKKMGEEGGGEEKQWIKWLRAKANLKAKMKDSEIVCVCVCVRACVRALLRNVSPGGPHLQRSAQSSDFLASCLRFVFPFRDLRFKKYRVISHPIWNNVKIQ